MKKTKGFRNLIKNIFTRNSVSVTRVDVIKSAPVVINKTSSIYATKTKKGRKNASGAFGSTTRNKRQRGQI